MQLLILVLGDFEISFGAGSLLNPKIKLPFMLSKK